MINRAYKKIAQERGERRGIYSSLDPGLGPSGTITLSVPDLDPATMCNNELCLLFDSKHGTPCSPMRNVETSILLQWSTILLSLELNASSEERITQMGAFICTLSLTSAGNIGPGTLEHSMFKDATRMYRHHVEHQKRGMIMQSKMETLLQGDSKDLQEAEWIQLVMCGLRSSTQRTSKTFGTFANHWLHVHLSPNSHNSEHSLPGNSHQSECRMKLRRELTSTRLGWLNSMAGYETILEQLKTEVSYLARRPNLAAPTRGAFGGTSPRGTPPPSARGLECARKRNEMLTSIYRTKKITCGIRTFPNGKNRMGEVSGKTCLFRRPLQYGRGH